MQLRHGDNLWKGFCTSTCASAKPFPKIVPMAKLDICVNSESVKPSCLEAWHNSSIRFCHFTYMFKGFSSSDCRDFTFVFSWSKSFWSCNTSFFISSIFCAVFCKLASSCLSLLTSILKTRTSSSLSRKIASPNKYDIK